MAVTREPMARVPHECACSLSASRRGVSPEQLHFLQPALPHPKAFVSDIPEKVKVSPRDRETEKLSGLPLAVKRIAVCEFDAMSLVRKKWPALLSGRTAYKIMINSYVSHM